jgi:hypothetical protein
MPMPDKEIDKYAVQVGRGGGVEGRERIFEMLIHSNIANHYDSVTLGSLHATKLCESYLKILKI